MLYSGDGDPSQAGHGAVHACRSSARRRRHARHVACRRTVVVTNSRGRRPEPTSTRPCGADVSLHQQGSPTMTESYDTIVSRKEGRSRLHRLQPPASARRIERHAPCRTTTRSPSARPRRSDHGDRQVRGQGRAFSAGFDMKASAGRDRRSTRHGALMGQDFDFIVQFWDCPKPTIAAVHGFCIAGAFELVCLRHHHRRRGHPLRRARGALRVRHRRDLLPWVRVPSMPRTCAHRQRQVDAAAPTRSASSTTSCRRTS